VSKKTTDELAYKAYEGYGAQCQAARAVHMVTVQRAGLAYEDAITPHRRNYEVKVQGAEIVLKLHERAARDILNEKLRVLGATG
jgi:hypothetical protein